MWTVDQAPYVCHSSDTTEHIYMPSVLSQVLNIENKDMPDFCILGVYDLNSPWKTIVWGLLPYCPEADDYFLI